MFFRRRAAIVFLIVYSKNYFKICRSQFNELPPSVSLLEGPRPPPKTQSQRERGQVMFKESLGSMQMGRASFETFGV